MKEKPQLSSERLRRLLRHLLIASKKYNEQQETKRELQQQLKQIRTVSGKPNTKLDEELTRLEEKLNKVLQIEGTIAAGQERETQKVEGQLKDLNVKLDQHAENEKISNERARELEKRIKELIEGDRIQIAEIKKKMAVLEQVYLQLVDAGAPEQKLKQIRERIDKAKEDLKGK